MWEPAERENYTIVVRKVNFILYSESHIDAKLLSNTEAKKFYIGALKMDGCLKKILLGLIGGIAFVTLGVSFSIFGGFSLINISCSGYVPDDVPTGIIRGTESSDDIDVAFTYEDSEPISESITYTEFVNVIDGTVITGALDEENQINEYEYTASVSGKYRFDFDINDVNNNYIFSIYDSKNESIGYGYSSNGGITVGLQENCKYKICVEQNTGECVYNIVIGVPTSKETVIGNEFGGSIIYEDQQDIYTFVSTVAGRYRFDFDINNVANKYKFTIYDSKKAEIGYGYSNNGGITVGLQAKSEYTICMEQINGVCDYSVKIGVPLSKQAIKGSAFSGNITYVEQQNYYQFTSVNEGNYRFDFDVDNVNNRYKFTITNEKNKQIGYEYSNNGGITVQLAKDSKYVICVEQIKGFPNYTINIGMPKKTVKLNSNSISGAITYKDQNDCYTYVPKQSGEYKFELNINNVDNNYKITVYDSKNRKLGYELSSRKSVVFDLAANETYTIHITQNMGTCNYNINISVLQ